MRTTTGKALRRGEALIVIRRSEFIRPRYQTTAEKPAAEICLWEQLGRIGQAFRSFVF